MLSITFSDQIILVLLCEYAMVQCARDIILSHVSQNRSPKAFHDLGMGHMRGASCLHGASN